MYMLQFHYSYIGCFIIISVQYNGNSLVVMADDSRRKLVEGSVELGENVRE